MSMAGTSSLLIGVTACRVRTEAHAYLKVTEKYATVVTDEIGGCPLLIPALETGIDPALLVARLDGILLTGSPSNVDPRHYRGTSGEDLPPAGDDPAERDPDEHDPARDAVTLPLIRAAVAAGVPLLGLCRGMQEMNVAFGGSLVRRLHDDVGRFDHRMRRDVPFDWK